MIMFTIKKEFTFSASHILDCLESEHPCSRMHGHNYQAIFEFKSKTLSEVGFVIDYRELSLIKAWIDQYLDHRHLNDVMSTTPSAENIATHLFFVFKRNYPQLSAVTIKETPKTEACYEPDID